MSLAERVLVWCALLMLTVSAVAFDLLRHATGDKSAAFMVAGLISDLFCGVVLALALRKVPRE